MLTGWRRSEQDSGSAPRDLSVEGIRGLAAVVVLLWHDLLGFFPRQTGLFDGFHHSGLRAMPWYGLVYGTAAVTVFFVLSGLVLSRAYLRTGDASIIGRGAVKRWPRLAGPVVVVVMISALLDRCGLYRFDEAAAFTGSPWLAGHLFHGIAPGTRGLFDALLQGVTTFFSGAAYYDTSLWTMRYEMTGSFLVFGLALVLGQVRASRATAVYVIGVYALISFYVDPVMMAFVAGVAVADLQTRTKLHLPTPLGALMVIVGLYLLGYSGLAVGWYRPVAAALAGGGADDVHVLAAVLIILAVDGSPRLKTAMSARLCAFLGWISFPLYLVHIPILCSAGAATFLALLPLAGPRAASLGAVAATIALSVLTAIFLARLNGVWTVWIDALARRCIAGRQASPSVSAEGRRPGSDRLEALHELA